MMQAEVVWVVVPVKPLAQSKSRLAELLSAESRAMLTRSLLTHLLVTIEQSAAVAQTLVVTRDPDVAELARTFGARVFSEEDPLDLNVAVTSAVELAQQRGAMTTMVLPSDLPFITPQDIHNLLAVDANVVLCPDRHNSGTNALVLRSANGFVFQYGKDSFHLHLAEAARQGVSAEICRSPGVRFDLDTEEDWQQYQQQIKHEKQATEL
ncbi:MAG: 2-phospho-L-lactate guanylyltransferase [Anaerolineae bacterium]|nr:2-phospho-L-lactate guanylyltransferase [Anaerolineae bacterium]